MATRQDASTGKLIEDGMPLVPAAADGEELLRVKVHSPYQTYFDGDAFSISALNSTGPFDILPRHHNFMTLLLPCELHIHSPLGDKRIRIARGVMHVKADRATVFLDV